MTRCVKQSEDDIKSTETFLFEDEDSIQVETKRGITRCVKQLEDDVLSTENSEIDLENEDHFLGETSGSSESEEDF